MSENTDPPAPSKAEGTNQLPWQYQLGFAAVLTVLFVVLVAVMLGSAGGSQDEWQNRVYVFGSVEALVFTAIGWVFGREVQRSQVQDAKAEAKKQSEKADAAQEDAAQSQTAVAELATGVRIATVVEGEAGPSGGAEDASLDNRRPAGSVGRSAALGELRALADRLHPPAARRR